MTSPDVVTIENDHWRVGLVPATGGAIAFGQVRVDDAWVDVMRPTPEESLTSAPDTASYPLAPWANRIREGKLKWQGRTYQLRVNFPDGTAIHGTATEYPWHVIEASSTRVVLEFVSREVYGVNFPWTFSTRFTYALEGERFTCTMELTNTDHETFPAGLGHHPYFVRSLSAADGSALSEEAQLQINCAKGYALTDLMATDHAGEVPARADFREMRPIGQDFADDCLTDRLPGPVATIEYPDTVRIDLEAGELCSHAVVFIPPGLQHFAMEPVTNANNAFELDDAGIDSVGVFLVQPGETRNTEFSLVATAL